MQEYLDRETVMKYLFLYTLHRIKNNEKHKINMKEIYLNISQIITCLFLLSIRIRTFV